MMTFSFIAATALSACLPTQQENGLSRTAGNKESHVNYVVDPSKSTFTWNAKKVTGEHTGTIDIVSGSVIFNKGMLLGGQFEMDMQSIANTDLSNEGARSKLENHLKSADFFDVENYPTSVFKARVWAPIKDAAEGASNYYIKGDLTIKGITREISFAARVDLTDESLHATAEFDIDRTQFEIKFRSVKFFPDVGDKLIEDHFKVTIDLFARAVPNKPVD